MIKVVNVVCLAALCVGSASGEEYAHQRLDFQIRDPFVVVADGKYHMYESKAWSGGSEVWVRTSRDLEHWSDRKAVMQLPTEYAKDCTAVWAPEVHRYNGKYYLFVTLSFPQRKDDPIVAMGENVKAGNLCVRGTWIFASDSPEGPFVSLRKDSLTPRDWMCLDGTLYVERGEPWIVFCHEWCQVGNGRMMIARLSKDLSRIIGEPKEIFRAASFPGAGNVTDGPFVFASKASGKLEMIYSNFIKDRGYSVLKYESVSGSIVGPWKFIGPVYEQNGGHAMIFRKLDGSLALTLHQPNGGGKERMRYFPVVDTAEGLKLADQ
ncbi:MAG: family 43 glycosylhydrolase [Kiritimatiellia bacterium]